MPIVRTARYQLRPEAVDKCKQAIAQFVDYIKANEPSTLRYSALQQGDDPTVFLHFMIFQDEAAEQRHRESPGTRRFTAVLYPETIDGVRFDTYAVAAST